MTAAAAAPGTAAFAAGLSEHPDPRQATAEVIGQVLEGCGPSPDVVVAFVTGAHLDHLDDIVASVQGALAPAHLLGAASISVIGGRREVEEQPAVSLWAARNLPARPVRITARREPDGGVGLDVEGMDGDAAVPAGPGATLLLLADPFSLPLDDLLAHLASRRPDLALIGGLASASFRPGGNRLVLDGEVLSDGAVGLLLGPDAGVATVVSQGCRPIGDPYTVTAAEDHVIAAIGGVPALRRLVTLMSSLPEHERDLVQRGLHVGLVIDEHKAAFGRGDFLVRNLAGVDRQRDAIAVNDVIEVGSTVQFQVRDAEAADEELRLLLAPEEADAALVFTCNGRGTHLFGRPDHDAEVVVDATGAAATAGMFCAGEVGPVGGRNFVHAFTASIALFRAVDAAVPPGEGADPTG